MVLKITMPKESNLRIGLYPGTFDPVTNGHLDIIKRAVKLVDRLVIGVALNPGKQPLLSLEERVACLHEEMVRLFGKQRIDFESDDCPIKVVGFNNLLVNCVKENHATVLIRGLRQATDFNYEFQMCIMNQQLAPDIETIFLVATEQHRSIASSLVKEVAMLGGDISSFVPPSTLKHFKTLLAKKVLS